MAFVHRTMHFMAFHAPDRQEVAMEYQRDLRHTGSDSGIVQTLASKPCPGILMRMRPADILLDLQRQAGNHPFGASSVTAGAETGHVVIESGEYRHFGLLQVTDPADCRSLLLTRWC